MKKQTYKEKLLDPRWQKKRLEIFERDKFQCQICGSKDKTLHIHHKVYMANNEPWEYEDELLITLCWECHEFEQDNVRESIETSIRLLKSLFLSEGIDLFNSILVDMRQQHQIYDRKPQHIITALSNLLDNDAGYDFLEKKYLNKKCRTKT